MTQETEEQVGTSWAKDFFSLSSFIREKSLLLLAILGVLAFAMTGCESKKTIVNGLDEREANEILVLLARENVPTYKLQ